MHYRDTSALAKLYVSEADSARFAAHVAASGAAMSSELARWEFFRVLVRKEAEALILAGAAQVIFTKFLSDVTAGNLGLLPIDQNLESRFQQLVVRLH